MAEVVVGMDPRLVDTGVEEVSHLRNQEGAECLWEVEDHHQEEDMVHQLHPE